MKLATISQNRGDHERYQDHARVSTREQYPGPSIGMGGQWIPDLNEKRRTNSSLSALGFRLRYSLSPT